jgi:DNA-binding GntR family transcriptional regulator
MSEAAASGLGPLSSQEIHVWLRHAILRGDFRAGERLSQVALAQRLGVSRTPLREALRMLQREGLVEGEPNQRVRIAGVSLEDLEELYSIRIALESLGARLTLGSITEPELAALGESLDEMERLDEVGDFSQWDVPHRTFHRTLVSHAGLRVVRSLSELFDHAERYRRLISLEPRALARAGTEHRAIYDAVCNGDAEEATELLARHISSTALTLLAGLAPEHDPVAIRTALRMVSKRLQPSELTPR